MTARVTMSCRPVPLARIDLADRRYRLGRPGDDAALTRSIQRWGLLQVPVVQGIRPAAGRTATSPRWRPVCGFRRLEACRRLRWEEVVVREVPPEADALDCLSLAVVDNAHQRGFTPLELAGIYRRLRELLPSEADLTARAADLGLPDNVAYIRKLAPLTHLPPAARRAMENGRLALSTALTLAAVDPPGAAALARLLDRLAVGANKQREIVTLVQDLAGQRNGSITAVLADGELRALVENPELDRHQKAARIRDWLHRRRFPELTRARERFQRQRDALALPAGMSLTATPYFESPVLTLSLTFSRRAQLADQAQRIHQLAASHALARLTREAD